MGHHRSIIDHHRFRSSSRVKVLEQLLQNLYIPKSSKLPRAHGSNIICSSVCWICCPIIKSANLQKFNRNVRVPVISCHSNMKSILISSHLSNMEQPEQHGATTMSDPWQPLSPRYAAPGSKYAPWLASMHWVNTPRMKGMAWFWLSPFPSPKIG